MKEKTLEDTIAENLRAVMLERGYANEIEFSKAVGVAQKTINNLLNARATVSTKTTKQITRSLNIPEESLFLDISNPSVSSMKAISNLARVIGSLSIEDRKVIEGMAFRLSGLMMEVE